MTPMRRTVAQIVIGLAVASMLVLGSPAAAQVTVSGPSVTLETTQLAPGDFAVYTLEGFEARSVVVAFCGNDGLRGSMDCNMTESDGLPLSRTEATTTSRSPVAAPPAPCPCIVRVSSPNNDEVAATSITIVGHPIAELVAPTGFMQPLTIEVNAEPADAGLMDTIRSSAGGPRSYSVEVSVRNRSNTAVRGVRLSGQVGRDATEELASIDADDIEVIEPGQTVTQMLDVELPSLSLGDAQWRVTASGVGPSITATDTSSRSAWLLWVLVFVLFVDLLVLAARLLLRLHRGRPRPERLDNSFIDPPSDGDGFGRGSAPVTRVDPLSSGESGRSGEDLVAVGGSDDVQSRLGK